MTDLAVDRIAAMCGCSAIVSIVFESPR